MDLKSLILEKEELENRMKKLEAMKGQIKLVIYEKIKNEYEEKLKNIFEQIKKDAEFVKSEIEKINVNEKEINEKISDLELEIEELNVRSILGEITLKEFEEKKQILDDKKNQLHNQLRKLQEDKKELTKILPQEKMPVDLSMEQFREKIVYENNLVYPESKIETNFPPIGENLNENVQPEELDKDLSENIQSAIDNIIQPDIVKEEKFSLGEDLPKEEKMVKDNPLEMNNKKYKSEDDIVFEKDFEVNVKEENIETIEGLVCPKCGHINRSDLFNCEKCGAELL
ncbi:MAG: hypothetical protein ABIN39_03880 [candidate division WOR-3 bacterium]